MDTVKLVSISPNQLSGMGEAGAFDMSPFARKYLAQGDSWFSIGHLPPWCTSNLLQQMLLSRSAVAVNCARPGVELAHMTDRCTAPAFLSLLGGVMAWRWDAILLSGGGNDLIDAANSDTRVDAQYRLLLNADEWSAQGAASRYLSAAGWGTFTEHMDEVLALLLAQRDRSLNRGVPVVLHTYDYVCARNAPAGPGLGPWLYKALHDSYASPQADWAALANLLIDRLAAMWIVLGQKYAALNVHVVDTRGSLARAAPETTGVSGDWENEIHPTPHGYALLAQKWRPLLDALP